MFSLVTSVTLSLDYILIQLLANVEVIPKQKRPPSSFFLILKKTFHTSFCFFGTSKLVSPQFLLFTLVCFWEKDGEKTLQLTSINFCWPAVAGFGTHCANRHGALHPRSNRDLKIRGRRRQRKRRGKSEFSFFQSSSRLLQVTNFVKCMRTLLKLNS